MTAIFYCLIIRYFILFDKLAKKITCFQKSFLTFMSKQCTILVYIQKLKGVYYETNIQKSVYDTDRFLDCPSHRYSAGYAD